MSKKRRSKNINAKGRSVYDGQQYLLLPYKLIKSSQFRGLNGNEVRVLLEICSRHTGFNNGRIGAGMTDLSNVLLMSKSTVNKALLGLQAFKLIKRIKKGRFHGRVASEWEVTFLKSENYQPTNEWAQQKSRKKKRKNKKSLAEELENAPEVREAEERKIKEWYQNETKHPD